jgi:hypothetical protein
MPFAASPYAACLNAAELICELLVVFDLAQLPQSLLDPFCGRRKSTRHTETIMDGSSKTAPAGQASALWMSTIAFTACFAAEVIRVD